MTTGKELRYGILRYLKERERTGSAMPELGDIAQALDVSSEAIIDQLDILEAQDAIDAHRTIAGGANPVLKGLGKVLLEELDEEYGDAAKNTRPAVQEDLESGYAWDVFIAHASEDKEPFVRRLAEALSQHFRVWYDEFSLKVGDSLRRKIDEGLAKSRYGIVVLSPNFFGKEWPQWELDGLTARERDGQKVILPVWLNVDHEEVARHSPMLAGRLAAKAKDGLERVVADLREAMRPEVADQNNAAALKSPHARTNRPVQDDPGTEVEIAVNGAKRRPPDMHVIVKVRHIYGPPVVPLAVRVWSQMIDGEMDASLLPAYLEPGKKLTRTVTVSPRPPSADDPPLDNTIGWPLHEAPDDLWVFFRYRSLDGQEFEVARTFGLERPANQNLFDVKGPTSHMKRQ